MLLPLTDGGAMIGITSTSHLLQFSTLAFQTIQLFHDNFLLELIFFSSSLMIGKLSCIPPNLTPPDKKYFHGLFLLFNMYFLSLTFADNCPWLAGYHMFKRSEPGANSGLEVCIANGGTSYPGKLWTSVVVGAANNVASCWSLGKM